MPHHQQKQVAACQLEGWWLDNREKRRLVRSESADSRHLPENFNSARWNAQSQVIGRVENSVLGLRYLTAQFVVQS
jgi:hypothetical protein